MFLSLLLAAAAPLEVADISDEVRSANAERAANGNAAFLAQVEILAERGDESAIELLGETYLDGRFGAARDIAKACGYFARTAERRGDSAHNFARCHERGEGQPANPVLARHWYARGAELGFAKSNCALGNLMIAGTGGSKDVTGGMGLCRKAAEQGVADAQTDLGNYLLAGLGGTRDIVEARKWYTLAAAQEQPNAQFVLGQIYSKGDGTPVDWDAAVHWWTRAYTGGRKDAAALIVSGLFKRIVVERGGKTTLDRSMLPEAMIWIERAATEDPDPAQRANFAEILAQLRGGA